MWIVRFRKYTLSLMWLCCLCLYCLGAGCPGLFRWVSTEQQQRCYRWCQWSVLFQPIIINRPPDTISAGLFPAQEWAAESKCNTDHNLIIKTQHNSANFRHPPLPAQELRLRTVGASNLVTRYSAQSWVVTKDSNEASRICHKSRRRPYLGWKSLLALALSAFIFNTLC